MLTTLCPISLCYRLDLIQLGKGRQEVPLMLSLDSSWAPATRITKMGPILRFEFPTKEAEIQARLSLKCVLRVNHRGTSGKQGTGGLPFERVAHLDHFGRQDNEQTRRMFNIQRYEARHH